MECPPFAALLVQQIRLRHGAMESRRLDYGRAVRHRLDVNLLGTIAPRGGFVAVEPSGKTTVGTV